MRLIEFTEDKFCGDIVADTKTLLIYDWGDWLWCQMQSDDIVKNTGKSKVEYVGSDIQDVLRSLPDEEEK